MFRPSRARRALLLVAFSVLASTATAHAELRVGVVERDDGRLYAVEGRRGVVHGVTL
jgi:hypothetical protein